MSDSDGSVSPLQFAAISLHEMFKELMAAGFSHDDALKLVGGVLAASVDSAEGPDSNGGRNA